MQPSTIVALSELTAIDWFSHVGEKIPHERVVGLSSWTAAVAHCSSDEWEQMRLESVNRIINVAFKFIPLRAGVDEGGTGQVSKVLGFARGIGVTLAIIRKGRDIFWSAIGLLLIWRKGLSLRSLNDEK